MQSTEQWTALRTQAYATLNLPTKADHAIERLRAELDATAESLAGGLDARLRSATSARCWVLGRMPYHFQYELSAARSVKEQERTTRELARGLCAQRNLERRINELEEATATETR